MVAGLFGALLELTDGKRSDVQWILHKMDTIGEQLFGGCYRERKSSLGGFDCQLCMLSESFLAANEHWSFQVANCFFTPYNL